MAKLYNSSIINSINSTAYIDGMPSASSTPWPYVAEPYTILICRLAVTNLIAIIGFMCNILVMVQIGRGPRPPPVEVYIRNLAIADLGVLCLSFPIAIIREQLPSDWPLGKYVCELVYPLTEVFYAVSVWSITAIAVERYHVVVKRASITQKRIATGARWRVIIIWIVSFLLTSLPLFFIMEHKQTPQESHCRFVWPSWMQHTYVIALTILEYLLPLGLISFTYIRISKVIQQSSAFHQRTIRLSDKYTWGIRRLNSTEARRLKENARARRILTPLVLVFAITMFPLNTLRVISLLWHVTREWKYFLVVYNVSVLAVVFNSTADPVIYFIASRAMFPALCGRLRRMFRRRAKKMEIRNEAESDQDSEADVTS